MYSECFKMKWDPSNWNDHAVRISHSWAGFKLVTRNRDFAFEKLISLICIGYFICLMTLEKWNKHLIISIVFHNFLFLDLIWKKVIRPKLCFVLTVALLKFSVNMIQQSNSFQIFFHFAWSLVRNVYVLFGINFENIDFCNILD